MKLTPNLSVRIKLVGTTMLIGIVALSGGLALRMRNIEALLEKNFKERSRLTAWSFSLMAQDWADGQVKIGDLAGAIFKENEVEYIAIYNLRKQLVGYAGDFMEDDQIPLPERPRYASIGVPDDDVYIVIYPVLSARGEAEGYIAVGFSREYINTLRAENRHGIAATWSVVLLFVLAASYVTLGRIIKPLENIKNAITKVGDGNFDNFVPAGSNDEIGVVAREYNSMVMRLRELYSEMARANRKLAEISERKTEFLTTVAHDLRTPLALISGFAETLTNKDLTLGDLQKETYLHTIIAETRKMAGFISNYLDVTKIEEGLARLVPVVSPVEEIVRAAVESFDFKAARVAFAMHIAPEAKEIKADTDMLVHALQNLIGNALKWSPRDSAVTLEIFRKDRLTVFVVSDLGPGVPDDIKEKIFEKFFRAKSEASKKTEGAGLGLAIVRSIAKLHGGGVRVEDNSPRGSRFVFTIPDAP